jgi:hypothetical protein
MPVCDQRWNRNKSLNNSNVRLQVLTAASMKFRAFWDAASTRTFVWTLSIVSVLLKTNFSEAASTSVFS